MASPDDGTACKVDLPGNSRVKPTLYAMEKSPATSNARLA